MSLQSVISATRYRDHVVVVVYSHDLLSNKYTGQYPTIEGPHKDHPETTLYRSWATCRAQQRDRDCLFTTADRDYPTPDSRGFRLPFAFPMYRANWRDVAMGLPLLWLKFTLNLVCCKPLRIILLPLHLERSRTCLLDTDPMVNLGRNMSLSPWYHRRNFGEAITPRPRVSPRENKSVSLVPPRSLWTMVVEAIVR